MLSSYKILVITKMVLGIIALVVAVMNYEKSSHEDNRNKKIRRMNIAVVSAVVAAGLDIAVICQILH